jgi:hypothetical protein
MVVDMADDPMKRGNQQVRQAERARGQQKARKTREFRYVKDLKRDLPLLIARRLNDLKRQAQDEGYPIEPDSALAPLTEDEFGYMLRVANT